MTAPLDLEKISAFLALDGERSGGDWILSDVQTDEWDCKFYTLGGDLSESVVKCHYEDARAQIFDSNIPESEFHANAQFIAAASTMPDQIRGLLREVEALREALRNLYEHDADYIRINNLGHPNHNAVMLAAYNLLEQKP